MAAKLKWVNASEDNPGYTVWHTTPERDPNVLYAIRRKRAKRGFKPVGWRVFVRGATGDPLKTIYLAQTLKEAKTFVQEWEDVANANPTQ